MICFEPMKRYLIYRAGKAILNMMREHGLNPGMVRVFAGPAGGPKWFASVGFDRALMRSNFLRQAGHRVLLAGASAGAWRCLAMACRDPLDAYERLRIAYSRNVFTAADTPVTLSAALRRNVESFIREHDVPFILEHDSFDLAVHAVRSRGPAASANKRIEGMALLAAGLINVLSRRAPTLLYERVVFYSGNRSPLFLENSFNGRGIRMTPENLRMAALATGSLPYLIAGVKQIPAAVDGVYRDGGLIDYQINQDYCPGDGITLFFHHQERIIPGWFDKPLKWRNPPAGALDRVFQVCPTEDFVSMLPDGRIPDRQDFVTFADNPAARIRRWDQVSELSEILGEQFMEDVESGKIRDLVRPMA